MLGALVMLQSFACSDWQSRLLVFVTSLMLIFVAGNYAIEHLKEEYYPPAHTISDEADKIEVVEYSRGTGYIETYKYVLDQAFLSKFRRIIAKKK